MRYTTDKVGLLTQLQPILDKHKAICEEKRAEQEKVNDAVVQRWKKKQKKGWDLYNNLPCDWWKEFVTTEK